MRLLIDRWLSGPSSRRAACAGVWIALLVAAAYAGLTPLTRDFRQTQAQLEQRRAELRTLKQRQAAQSGERDAVAALEAQLAMKSFSPLALDPGPEGHLIHWQPQGDTGELALALAWPHVPDIFEALARSDMLAHGFTLSREGDQRLRLTLQLERAHEK